METELEILNERANRLTLFFIPYQLFPEFTDEQRKQAEDELFFGTLYLYKQGKIIVNFEKDFNQINLLSKKDLLANNILRLIEINEKGKKESFNFLLDKYASRIKGWEYIYDWLNNNAENNIVDLNASNKALLQFQLDITKVHLREIESRFGISDNIPSEQPENIFIENKDLVFTNGKTVHDIVKEKNDNSELVNKSKKRKTLISNEDADKYLLKTIFNIQFESIN